MCPDGVERGRRALQSVSPEPSPHRTSTFPRIRRSNPAPVWDVRCVYFALRYDSILLSATLSISPVCRDPFVLYPAFPDSLGGRHSTDYYGSAAPARTLATCQPIRIEVVAGSGVARTAISPSTVGALLLPFCLANQAGKLSCWINGPLGSLPHTETLAGFGSGDPKPYPLIRFHHPISHLFIGRVRRASPRIAHRRVVQDLSGYSGLPVTGSP